MAWRSLIFFLALVALTLSGAGQVSYAQEIDEQQPESNFSSIPDEYLQEAFEFEKTCSSSIKLNKYYNCQCLSVRYLDKRIELGKEAPQDRILLNIEGQCADATQAAGHLYSKCLGNAALMPIEIPPEKFCECYANTYAKLYESYGAKPNSKTFVRLQTEAMITCRKPELAKKLYPYKPSKK